jgi:hypothetical protein
MDDKLTGKRLIAAIQSSDANIRTHAWLRAGEAGAEALQPLAHIVAAGDLEISRAALRAMWRITRDAGARGAPSRDATTAALLKLLGEDQPTLVRREALWMVSEIAEGVRAAESVAALLHHKELGEDSRLVLERLPGDEAVQALQVAFRAAPEEASRYALAHSLRKRGVEVAGYPTKKLHPSREKE